MFDDMESELFEAQANKDLRGLESKYFVGITPILCVEIEPNTADPGRLETQRNTIVINSSLARWPKLRRIVILHELIHHKLLETGGDADIQEGTRFQREVTRLWELGAYKDMM